MEKYKTTSITELSSLLGVEPDEPKMKFNNQTYNIVSKVAYLIGVRKEHFTREKNYFDKDIFNELNENADARIIRNLCMLRSDLLRFYSGIYVEIVNNLKSLNSITQLIHCESIAKLEQDGVQIVKANTRPMEYIVNVNKLISERIGAVKSVFPIWIKWDFIRQMFIMPNGLSPKGIEKEKEKYQNSLSFYPYKRYINWNIRGGNILLSDKKFIESLYAMHGETFNDQTKVTDANVDVKESIYDFLNSSDKVCIFVDCENSDPYKLYAALKNLRKEILSTQIEKVVLYDDIHTSTGWGVFTEYCNKESIPTEHILIERIKGNKSLVDTSLTIGVTKELYKNNINSFIICSSDSDYWSLCSSLPEANFYVMVESSKCGADIKKAMTDNGINYCYLDDFCRGNCEEVKIAAVVGEVAKRVNDAISFNLNNLLQESYTLARTEFSANEKKRIYNDYIKKMFVKVDDEGNMAIQFGDFKLPVAAAV